jgi:hypothetical protein
MPGGLSGFQPLRPPAAKRLLLPAHKLCVARRYGCKRGEKPRLTLLGRVQHVRGCQLRIEPGVEWPPLGKPMLGACPKAIDHEHRPIG